MKILVTGGAGFIGFHLCQELERRGHQIVAIDNFFHNCLAPSDAIYGDVRNGTLMDTLIDGADFVFHLAAQIHVDYSIHHPQETIDINVNGTLNILESCTKRNVPLVFASTSEVYGTSQTEFMDERHPLDAQSPYGASKLAADRLCKAYADTYGTRVMILRNFNTFGEWQNDTSYGAVIAKFTRAALSGKPLYIYGNGMQERDYMYISDAIQMYLHCIDFVGSGIVVNAGTGKTVSINNLAEIIKELAGSNSPIEHIAPRAGEVQRLCADTTKAKSLGFKSKTDLDRDLARYVQWYANTNKQ